MPRLRYVDPAPYSEDEFRRAYDWMVGWNLVGSDAVYSDMVSNMH